MRILVTGASGLLGTALVPELRSCGHDVVTHSRTGSTSLHADLGNLAATEAMLDLANPAVVINLAAATNVDHCERDPAAAFVSNVKSVRGIASWILHRRPSCYLVQISTDQLYSGAGPHKEDDVLPINYYGYSKYLGELMAVSIKAAVLRTNLFGKSAVPSRPSFSDWIVDGLLAKKQLPVFDDVLFSPLSLITLSKLIAVVASRGCVGTYNVGSRSGISKADFAFALARHIGLQTDDLERTSVSQRPLAARRPEDMRMDSSSFESTMGIRLPTLDEEIALVGTQYVM